MFYVIHPRPRSIYLDTVDPNVGAYAPRYDYSSTFADIFDDGPFGYHGQYSEGYYAPHPVVRPHRLNPEWLEEQQYLAAYRRHHQQRAQARRPDVCHVNDLGHYHDHHYFSPQRNFCMRASSGSSCPCSIYSARDECCASRGVTRSFCGAGAQRPANLNDCHNRFRRTLRYAGPCRLSGKQDSAEPMCKQGCHAYNPPRRTCSTASDQKAEATHITLGTLFEHLLKELSSANQTSAGPQTKKDAPGPSTSDASRPAKSTPPVDKKPEEQPFNPIPLFESVIKAFAPPESSKPTSTSAPTSSEPKHTQQTTPPSSLKEELENRLYSDTHAEIRDTVQALLASLFTPKSATNTSTATSSDSSADTKGKGKAKEKEVSFTVPITDGSSKDVASALETVRNIEASFFSLESDFVFPVTLDFKKDAAVSSSVTGEVDTASVASLESKLSYSSRNAPVRYYMHALTALLSQLDAVESHGSEAVRERRKEVVDRVENALDDIEKSVEWRLTKANLTHDAKQEETHPSVETQVVVDTTSSEALPVPIKSTVTGESDLVPTTIGEELNKDVAPYVLDDDTQISIHDNRDSLPPYEVHHPFEVGTQTSSKEVVIDDSFSDLATLTPTNTPDNMSSSDITDTTITVGVIDEVSRGAAVTTTSKPGDISDSESDNSPPYLLRASEEPGSLSKLANTDHSGSETGVVVLKDDDVNSDWSEIEA